MAPAAALAGRRFDPTSPFEVTSRSVREFASAIGAADVGAAAPFTYPIVVAFQALRRLLEDPDSGLELSRLVHGSQRFEQHRPVRVGDVLTASLSVESVRSVGGADVVATRTEIGTVSGEPVCTAYATLLHRPIPEPA